MTNEYQDILAETFPGVNRAYIEIEKAHGFPYTVLAIAVTQLLLEASMTERGHGSVDRIEHIARSLVTAMRVIAPNGDFKADLRSLHNGFFNDIRSF